MEQKEFSAKNRTKSNLKEKKYIAETRTKNHSDHKFKIIKKLDKLKTGKGKKSFVTNILGQKRLFVEKNKAEIVKR